MRRADAGASRRLALASSLLFWAACAAPVPCRSPRHCGSGDECLANRCVPRGAEPVPRGSARLVLEPTLGAVVGQRASERRALPPTVTFGGLPALNQHLLLRFPGTWKALDVQAAFLLLQPAPEAEPTRSDVPVTVSLAAGAWSPGASRVPGSDPPESRGLARTRPPTLLRIDVTAQLRALKNRPDHGLLIRGDAGRGEGATYLTGADGAAPRLEVYGHLAEARR